MREIARIQFRGDSRDFCSAWNQANPVHPIEYGVVAIFRDHPEYQKLRALYDQVALPHKFDWYERIDTRYSGKELRSYELLQFTVVGDGGEGGNEYSAAYELRPICPGCALTKYVQVADVTINIRDFSAVPDSPIRRRCDLFETRFGEIIVSRAFKQLACDLAIPGVTFRDVRDHARRGQVSTALFQLIVEANIGLCFPPSPIERTDFSPECGVYRSVYMTKLPRSLGSEFYFLRTNYHGEPVVASQDGFGELPLHNPMLFVSSAFYLAMQGAGIKGYWVQPAHLIDQ